MAFDRPIESLDELMDGGVRERFNDALKKVWANIFDPNTNPKNVREIQLKVKIKPNKRLDAADFNVEVTTKLAPPEPLQQTVMLQLVGDGTIVATERTNQVPGQLDMDGNESIPKVVTFGEKKAD